MKIKAVHQFLAGFNPGDAISNEAIIFQERFLKLGIEGDIFAEHIHQDAKKRSKKYLKYTPKEGDLILYHHSIHSSILEFLKSTNPPLTMIYHNVTPYHFFLPYDLKLSWLLKRGREELLEFRNLFEQSFADSKYNRDELLQLGYANVSVLPILYDFQTKGERPEKDSSQKANQILFVGRIAPNKKQEDLIKLVRCYKELYDENIHLSLVGFTSNELLPYKDELVHLIDFLGLQKNVTITDFLNEEEIIREYRKAKVFVSMSEHEGFCVPLLEAMHFRVPILAFKAGAVEDTLGGAGILLQKKDFTLAAYFLHKIFTDQNFSDQLIDSGDKRLSEYQNIDPFTILHNRLEQVYEI